MTHAATTLTCSALANPRPPVPATLHQLRSEQTRERLLDAAIALMDAKGHGQWSVHEVARAAGMTSGAVQHHFASKATLMLELTSSLP